MAWKIPVIFAILATTGLSACDENGEFSLSGPGSEDAETGEASAAGGDRVIEQDVEAPEIFEANEAGLWDGRPSLGGVWVAHPDVKEPERALIRNATTGTEVIGALFRRERENPGPKIQVSSDAADSLGILAGQPVQLEVVALKRETITIPGTPTEETIASAEPSEITEGSLDPIAAAEAAIAEAEGGTAVAAAPSPTSAPRSAPAAPLPAPVSNLSKPYVQIGIFSQEANANNTAASLRNVGIVPTIRRQESQGKEFWRVIVGPAGSSNDRAQVLQKVQDLGFSDAYFVTN